MLTVTDNARQHLKELLHSRSRDSKLGVRLALGTPGQFGVLLDQREPGDYVVEHEGAKVLLIGPELVPLVAGTTLDTESTPQGKRLTIRKEPWSEPRKRR